MTNYDEKFIMQKALEEQRWNEEYKEQEKRYLEYIDTKLAEETKESRESILNLLKDTKFLKIYQSRNEMAYIIVIMQIYEIELSGPYKRTILDMGKTVNDLQKKYIELKFILWRIEFEKDDQAPQNLIKYINNNHASPDMIRGVISNSSFDKVKILIVLIDLFTEKYMFRYAFNMLEFLNELCPYQTEILQLLAEFCRHAGNETKAEEYLAQIKET